MPITGVEIMKIIKERETQKKDRKEQGGRKL